MKLVHIFILSLFIFLHAGTTSFAAPQPFPVNVTDPVAGRYPTLGALIGGGTLGILWYALTIAGLATLAYVIWAGFRLLLSEGNPKKLEVARAQLLQALTGFIIVFASYWIIQIIEVILGIQILS
jgi:hypothetical protein